MAYKTGKRKQIKKEKSSEYPGDTNYGYFKNILYKNLPIYL